jgi:hypothetical protein
MKFPMIGQEKYDLLILVTAWAGLTVYTKYQAPFPSVNFY